MTAVAVPRATVRSRAATTASGLVDLLVLVAVSAGAATITRLFRDSMVAVSGAVLGSGDPTRAAGSRLGPAVVVGGGLAVVCGWAAVRRHHQADALRAAVHGERTPGWPGATGLRTAGIWLASAAGAPVGREAVLLESGALLGSEAGRRSGRHGAALAAAGIAAAFAGAYHAPIAAAVYVHEHVRVTPSPRRSSYVVAGALVGHLVSVGLLGKHPVLPAPTYHGLDVLAAAALLAVPAALSARAFTRLRSTLTRRIAPNGRGRTAAIVGAVALAAGLVAWRPLAAGNGLETIRGLGGNPAVWALAAVLAVRLLAPTLLLAAGAPGGVFSPSLAVAAAGAAGALALAGHAGLPIGGAHGTDAVVLAAAAGIAVVLRSPLVACTVVAEMTGDLRAIPVTVAVVAIAVLVTPDLRRRLPAGPTRGSAPAGASR